MKIWQHLPKIGVILTACAILFVSLFIVNQYTKDDTVKIGVLLPLTGPAESTGTKLKYAIETAEEIINGRYSSANLELGPSAGLPNMGGKKVKFIFADHRANPETARTEAIRLIKDEKVAALIGAYHSSATKTASQVAEEYKVPFLAGSSSSASLTTRGYSYFFRIAPDDNLETEFFFEYIKYLNEALNAGIKTLGVVYIDNEYGTHASEMIDKWLDERYADEGFEKVVEVRYSEDLNNMDEGIEKIKKANPDVIFQASYIEDVTQFVKRYKEENIVPKAVLNYCGGFHDPYFIDALGADGNYFSGSSASLPSALNNETANFINNLYREKSGEDIDGPALEEFASALIMADAINTSSSLEGDKIANVLRTKEFLAPYFISNTIRFNEAGQNIRTISFMVQIQNGRYEAVWPLEMQYRKPQILSK